MNSWSTKTSKVHHYKVRQNSKLNEERKRQVISSVVKMLKSGESDFSIRKLSKDLDVTERHIYRLFDGLEGLGKYVNEEMHRMLGTDVLLNNLNRNNITITAVSVFQKFNKNSKILEAYLDSSLGKQFREAWLDDKDKLLKKSLQLVSSESKKLRQSRLVFSAGFWKTMKAECQFSNDEILEVVELLASRLQAKLLSQED